MSGNLFDEMEADGNNPAYQIKKEITKKKEWGIPEVSINDLNTNEDFKKVRGQKVSLEEVGYPMKHTPYRHQLECWKHSKDSRNFALFMEMGTGKSKVAIDTAAYLWDQKKITGLLVLAPKGNYSSWETEHVPEHMPDHVPYTLCRWGSYMLKDDMENARTFCKDPKKLHILLMNVEGLVTKKNKAIMKRFCDIHEVLLIIDESVCIKNPSAVKTKFLLKSRDLAKYKRLLSGLPMPNGFEDLFSQYQFLDPEILNCSSIYGFRNRYCTMREVEVGGGRSIKVVASYRNIDHLKKKVAPFTFIVKKADCLDLPPKVFKRETFSMGPKQAKMYEKMKNDSFIELEDMEGEGIITAQAVITRLQKLHQIACGFIRVDDKDIEIEDSPRLDCLTSIIEDSSGQLVIWSTYLKNVSQIEELLKKKYGRDSYVTYQGPTKQKDRDKAKRIFMNGECRFFIGTKAGGRGLNFQAYCHQTVYYSSDYDLDFRLQSEDRVNRIGQEEVCIYTDICAIGTEDENILSALRSKQRMSDDFLVSNWKHLLK